MRTRLTNLSWVCWAALALIGVQLVVRAVLAFGGYFYWDDLILIGKAGTQPLASWSYLFDDHDGHVMPAGFAVAGVITRCWPLNWVPVAVSLVVGQLVASLALWRTLRVILGDRPVQLVWLTFALFCPMGLPAFAWWAAALNALPMIAALAWVCGDAILLVRTGSRRYAITGTLACAGGLAFFEKAAVIPVVAFTVVVLTGYVRGDAAPIRSGWRAGRALWLGMLALTGGEIALYLAVVNQRRWSFDLTMTAELLWRGISRGIVPTLAGGPWDWARWAPASPWAVPGPTVMALGTAVLAGLAVGSVARKRRLAPVWLAAAGYAAACQVPIYLMRSSAFTVLELAQTLRYLPDLLVVCALLGAIGCCAPNRAPNRAPDRAPARRPVPALAVAALTAAFTASSLYSTATFLTVWRDDPARPYLHNARAALAAAHAQSDAPLLDFEVDPLVLQRVVYPENLASHLFALLTDRPAFAAATPQLRIMDSAGRLHDATVTWVRTLTSGPVPHCGYLVQPDAPVQLGLDGPLLPADWTAELNYLANVDGAMTLALSDGPAVRVRVHPGLNRIYVRLPGAGEAITARADTAALSVCIAAGPIGHLAPR